MGLTLPLLGASAIVRGARVGPRLSALYAANTGEALTGSLLAGYELIGAIGMQRTYLAAAALNVLVGVGALWLSRGDERADARADVPATVDTTERTRRAIATVIVVSGAASLALEIVWFRILLQFLAATTYAFTTMLATVLGGIALGGVISVRVLSKPRDWQGILVRVLFAMGIAVVVSLIFLIWSSTRLAHLGDYPGVRRRHSARSHTHGRGVSHCVEAWSVFRVERKNAAGSVADRVGRLYALNVAGAIVGALAGGFVLLPLLGSNGRSSSWRPCSSRALFCCWPPTPAADVHGESISADGRVRHCRHLSSRSARRNG